MKNRDFIAGNLETEYNKNSEDLHRWNEKRSITAKNQAVMNIWVKKEQEDKIMQRIGLDKNWDFYESDESMSFVFATPSSQKVDLPHNFIVGKPRSADAPGVP